MRRPIWFTSLRIGVLSCLRFGDDLYLRLTHQQWKDSSSGPPMTPGEATVTPVIYVSAGVAIGLVIAFVMDRLVTRLFGQRWPAHGVPKEIAR